MSATVEILLKRNLREVFGERDPTKRRSAIAQIWAKNGVFVDHEGRHVGHDEIDAAAAALQKRLPDHVFTQTGAPQVLSGAGRLAWSFGPPHEPGRVTGVDVLVAGSDKIEAVYVFLDSPAS